MKIKLTVFIFILVMTSGIVYAIDGGKVADTISQNADSLSWGSPSSLSKEIISQDKLDMIRRDIKEIIQSGGKKELETTFEMLGLQDVLKAILNSAERIFMQSQQMDLIMQILKHLKEITLLERSKQADMFKKLEQTEEIKKHIANNRTKLLDVTLNNQNLTQVKTFTIESIFGMTLYELFDVLYVTDCWVNLNEFHRYKARRKQAEEASKGHGSLDDYGRKADKDK